jgi:uncharacterized membrane protein YhaH (DUF805 family)
MNYQQLLFSFKGRIRRQHYWLGVVGAAVVVVIAIIVGRIIAAMGNALTYVGVAIMIAAYVALFWVAIALYIKRLHDRDMTWVWIFCPIYPAFLAAFLDGTQGPNKYGPSPKGVTGPAIATAAAGPAA